MKQETQRQKTYPVVSTKLHHCLKEELKKKKDISLCSLEHQIPEILKHLDTQTFPEIRSFQPLTSVLLLQGIHKQTKSHICILLNFFAFSNLKMKILEMEEHMTEEFKILRTCSMRQTKGNIGVLFSNIFLNFQM